jgi:hypothetical protein
MIGGGSGVAVNSRVGNGVFVDGRGVKVETRVALMGTKFESAGWNGVGEGKALGIGVTSTSVGGTVCPEVGRVHEVRRSRSKRRGDRRGCLIRKYSGGRVALSIRCEGHIETTM